MSRTKFIAFFALMLAATSCGSSRETTAPTVDCSVADKYDFHVIFPFSAGDTGWYQYADPTNSVNAPDSAAPYVSQALATVDRCGDTSALELQASGYNFWGAGFASWQYESGFSPGRDANGDPIVYEGISFWARTGPASERTFMVNVDDGSSVILTAAKVLPGQLVDGVCDPNRKPTNIVETCSSYQAARAGDQDFNGDGLLEPGDIAAGTRCRIPPIQSVCDPACYYGGVQPPTAAACVPSADECGNQFHKYITTTEQWQLFLIPWSELGQWPCPNRSASGIDPLDLRRMEIKTRQGMDYDIYIDNIAFYRLRPDAGG